MGSNSRIVSFNLRGVNQGRLCLVDLLASSDLVLVQEHWLLPADLNSLDCDDNFCLFASSAVTDTVSSNILYGRPFGAWHCLFANH
jgi:hypothetical protein